MPYGYHDKILRVNLTTGDITVEKPGEAFFRTYFGGTGLIAYYLLKELAPDVDPLGPENKLIFAPGPLTGVPFGGAGRNGVGAKSPLTGGFGCGEGGGFFGAELKRAGWDAIIFEGRAEHPVYLWIKDDHVELRDASHLWGKETLRVQETLRAEHNDRTVRTAQCGIAGQNLVRYAGIANDVTHYVGRTGNGAVMGSKNLCAVAVKATKQVPVADPAAVREQAQWLVRNAKELKGGLTELGTAGGVMGLNATSALPTRNFREGQFEGAEKISGTTMRDTILIGRDTCFACPIRCKRVVKTEDEHNVDPEYGGPEYETIGSLGSVCGIDDLPAIAKGNELCNAYALDTISAGMTIAFAMECFENGIITLEDTDGIDLRFGNAKAMLAMLEKIAHREGIGDILAEGSMRAAEKFGKGAEKFAIHVKGQELPMHEPRLKTALGVGYAVSPTGADHMHNIHDTGYTKPGPEIDALGMLGILSPLEASDLGEEKIRLMTYVTLWQHWQNCAVYCMFTPWPYERAVALTRAITGWNTSLFELMKVAERAVTLTRLFNLKHGFTEKDDYLNERIFTPFETGPLAGFEIGEDRVNRGIKLHYEMMGWSRDKGVPTEGKLAELGIAWAHQHLPEWAAQ